MTRIRLALLLTLISIGATADLTAQSGPVTPPPPEIIAAWGTQSFVDAQFGRSRRHDALRIGSDYALKADDEARDVVVVAAAATIEGHASDVVVIFGTAQIASTGQGASTSAVVISWSRLGSTAIATASPTKNAIQPPRLYVK